MRMAPASTPARGGEARPSLCAGVHALKGSPFWRSYSPHAADQARAPPRRHLPRAERRWPFWHEMSSCCVGEECRLGRRPSGLPRKRASVAAAPACPTGPARMSASVPPRSGQTRPSDPRVPPQCPHSFCSCSARAAARRAGCPAMSGPRRFNRRPMLAEPQPRRRAAKPGPTGSADRDSPCPVGPNGALRAPHGRSVGRR